MNSKRSLEKSSFDGQDGHGLEEQLEPDSSASELGRSNGWIIGKHTRKIQCSVAHALRFRWRPKLSTSHFDRELELLAERVWADSRRSIVNYRGPMHEEGEKEMEIERERCIGKRERIGLGPIRCDI